jgi:activator of HSP90 ATPase
MSDSIHQEVMFSATPERIYEALLDARHFSQMTGGAIADIDAKAGGAFSCFGGIISGRYSIVHFELTPADQGTKLTMTHAGFPSGMREHLDGGWHKMYWEPLKKYIARPLDLIAGSLNDE